VCLQRNAPQHRLGFIIAGITAAFLPVTASPVALFVLIALAGGLPGGLIVALRDDSPPGKPSDGHGSIFHLLLRGIGIAARARRCAEGRDSRPECSDLVFDSDDDLFVDFPGCLSRARTPQKSACVTRSRLMGQGIERLRLQQPRRGPYGGCVLNGVPYGYVTPVVVAPYAPPVVVAPRAVCPYGYYYYPAYGRCVPQ
jgi:hypothetical protein